MVQCIMCEDWFHAQHIDLDECVSSDDYNEVICPPCAQKYSFIIPYYYVCEQEGKQQADLNATSSTVQANEVKKRPWQNLFLKKFQNNLNAGTEASTTDANQTADYYEARKTSPVNNSGSENQVDCYYEKIKSVVPEVKTSRAIHFHNVDWRPMLCRCANCKVCSKSLKCLNSLVSAHVRRLRMRVLIGGKRLRLSLLVTCESIFSWFVNYFCFLECQGIGEKPP